MITDLPPVTSDLEAESFRDQCERILHAGLVLEALTREPVGPQPVVIPIKIHGVWRGRRDAVRSGRERSRE